MTHADPPLSIEKPILVISAGNSFNEIRREFGDFDDWIIAGLRHDGPVQRVDARVSHACPPPPERFMGAVISGSHAMVTDREPWSERLATWIRSCAAAEVPLLGICYGHQLIAHALGGHVGYNPRGLEIGTHSISLAPSAATDPLFLRMPPAFPAHLVHAQSVLALPAGAIVLASNNHDPHQAYRFGRTTWGVQFHPEFSAAAMRAYLIKMYSQLQGGERFLHLLDSVCDTADAARLLARFARLARAEATRRGAHSVIA